jgi:hypothetical protein
MGDRLLQEDRLNKKQVSQTGALRAIWYLCLTAVIFFLIRLVGGGVQLGPLGTAAIDWPVVASPG